MNFYINYFHVCPNNSAKFNRQKLIPTYFKLREIKAHLPNANALSRRLWENFINKWNKWEK